MAKSQVQFTKDNEYYTPKEFVDRFGGFDYDPATTEEKAKEFGINTFDTLETDGLSRDWTGFGKIWINPPFTRKHEFLAKAWETYQKSKNDIYILFPIEFLTTARFHRVCGGGKLYIPNGRIKFESGLGKKSSSPAFGSVVMKLQDTYEVDFFVL
jgi:phage N-6-adenine-methyltransferase